MISLIMPISLHFISFLFFFRIQVVLDYCGQFVGFGSFLKRQLYIHEFHPKSEKKLKMQLAVQHDTNPLMYHGVAF